jgi:1,4-dihydroxy-6-naphthoate synthase
VAPFHEIIDWVVSGRVAAGVVIHEAQLTFDRAGLSLVQDLGEWWQQRTGLPLPLGANAIKRDLDQRFGDGTIAEVTRLLAASVAYSLDHRRESLEYARGFARGLDDATIDAFVAKYVNRWTLDYGPRGRQAVRRLLDEAAAAGLAPSVVDLDVVAVANGS